MEIPFPGFSNKKKIIFLSIFVIFLFSGLVLAQQIQVITSRDNPRLQKIFEKLQSNSVGMQKLIVQGTNEGVYTSRGCKIIHRLSDSISMECPPAVNIPNAMKEEKLSIQTINLTDFTVLDKPNNDFLNVPQVWASGIRGKGSIVAFLDTGVDYNHPSLKNHILANRSFVSYTDDSMDDNGHGTHVTGIVASDGNPPLGNISANFSMGIAPESKIIMAKVCDSKGNCDVGDIVAGLEWVANGINVTVNCSSDSSLNCTGTTTKTFFPDVISISLGSSSTWINSNCDSGNSIESYFANKVNWAVGKGITVAVAAGNEIYGVSSPSCASQAISAGGVYWFVINNITYDTVFSQSGRGFPMKDHGVLAPYIAFSTLPNNNYGAMGGTSMSSPFVAGLVALMKEKKPSLTPAKIKNILFNSAVKLDPNQAVCNDFSCYQLPVFRSEDYSYEEGYGRIDAFATLNSMNALPTTILDSSSCHYNQISCPSNFSFCTYNFTRGGVSYPASIQCDTGSIISNPGNLSSGKKLCPDYDDSKGFSRVVRCQVFGFSG